MPEAGASPQGTGTSVDLAEAEKHKGDRLGEGKLKGECATGVQYVFFTAGKPLGLTRTWRQGTKVRGNNIKPGTAIASFQNGKYSNDHAAIFIEETKEGLWVWDQYNRPQKAWGKRLLSFNAKADDRSNNGNLFYTVEK
jgi:cell wall-associated NlpC family hydrolase